MKTSEVFCVKSETKNINIYMDNEYHENYEYHEIMNSNLYVYHLILN